MRITQFALDHSRVTITFLLLLLVGGLQTYITYPSKEDPEVLVREAIVSTYFPGMSVERVEDLITRKLEEKIREISEVKNIISISKTGASIIHVELDDRYFDIQPIWQDLRNKVEDSQDELPEGTIGPFVNDDFGDVAVATITLTGDGFSYADLRREARGLQNKLYKVPGVKKVDLHGIQEERVWIEFQTQRLAQFGISPEQIVQTLQTQNVILPGGKVDAGGTELVVEPTGNFVSIPNIETTVIEIPGKDLLVQLGDLVTIHRGYIDPPNQPVFFNDQPTIALAVSMIDGENIEQFGKRLTAEVNRLQQTLPVGINLSFATYQPEQVEKAISSVTDTLYITLIVVLCVVMGFMGLRVGLIVGTIIPMVMLMAFIVMRFFDIDLQRVSIAALIISLGLLVDNGIVVAEDIQRQLGLGKDRRSAVLATAKELSIPLLNSSLTTIFAFMPILLAESEVGEYTRSLAQVIIITLLCSWFLAMYATPFLCFYFMKKPTTTSTEEGSSLDLYQSHFYQRYRRWLEFSLRKRWLLLSTMVGTLIVAFGLFQLITYQFFPSSDRNQYLIYVDLPAGSGIKDTEAVVRKLSDWLSNKEINPEITNNIAYVGGGGPRFFLSLAPIDPDPHKAFITVNVASEKDVPELIERTRLYGLEELPSARLRVTPLSLGTTETGLVEVRLSGPDKNKLYTYAQEILGKMRQIDGIRDVSDDWENPTAKVLVLVDQVRARRAGVTSKDIADTLVTHFDGATITDYREGDTVIPIVLRAQPQDRGTLDSLRRTNVWSTKQKKFIPLIQIADLSGEIEFGQIKRRNQERTITLSAKHDTLQAEELSKLIEPILIESDLSRDPSYQWAFGGEIEETKEAQEKLFEYIPLCLFLLIAVLIWQFNSFRRTGIIILTVPLAFIGAVIGLFVTGAYFGFMASLGLFSLAGIIVNNAIVLIDRIDKTQKDLGLSPYDAIVEASITRLRPILMTTLSSIAGLTPTMLLGGDLWLAMAAVISFGLLGGTVLTLFVVPALYTLFFRVKVV